MSQPPQNFPQESRSDSTHPLVSIIIPCYNAEQYVAEAIQSALDQTYPNCEVIVIDDGSTDNSLDVIKHFGDRIYWETGPNRGVCAARNQGLELSRGEWIQFLDADDLLHTQRIEILVTQGCEYHKCDFVWSLNQIFTEIENLKSFKVSFSSNITSSTSNCPLEASYAPSASLFRSTFLESVGEWNESLSRWVDLEYHARVTKHCNYYVKVNLILYGYRQHCGPQISDANKNHTHLGSAIESLTLTEKHLEDSNIRKDVLNQYLLPFYFLLARSSAFNNDKKLFIQCIYKSFILSNRIFFRIKVLSLILIYSLTGISLTSRIMELTLPSPKQ